MYYLKYRPKTIGELDNAQVKEKIKNILESKDLPHAFLFVGQKGTGKTSTARIVAKSVNCLGNVFSSKGTSVEPCNKCSNCLAIETASSPDVVELDAASNRGIDEVRSLIRESSFSPMTSRFRVYIIDEAHMITHDAFNALLKTLEEPPASVLFILATTNQEKVPKTISSRCIILNFGKAKKSDILQMLQRILEKEKVTATEEVLQIIAAHSEKSFRDAAKLLEELVIQNKLTSDSAREYLGVRAQESLIQILQEKEMRHALAWIEEFSNTGGSFKNLLEEMLEELRYALLIKNEVMLPEDVRYSFSIQDISLLMKLFTEAYNGLRLAPIESIPLEIAVVEFYNKK
ncbi:DNA polymerase III subunit gamma/tau [Candidatus Roizmanbacteria bacterium]|nr:DNA polymerase III subunit gamma/tau [Candidatus Roizmanbacteria bacterium]